MSQAEMVLELTNLLADQNTWGVPSNDPPHHVPPETVEQDEASSSELFTALMLSESGQNDVAANVELQAEQADAESEEIREEEDVENGSLAVTDEVEEYTINGDTSQGDADDGNDDDDDAESPAMDVEESDEQSEDDVDEDSEDVDEEAEGQPAERSAGRKFSLELIVLYFANGKFAASELGLLLDLHRPFNDSLHLRISKVKIHVLIQKHYVHTCCIL